MIRHVVVWSFREHARGAGREENLRQAKKLLDELPRLILQIRSFEVGISLSRNDSSYDLALVSGFDSVTDLAAYQDHPEHRRVVEFLRSVHHGRVTVDYEVEQ